MCSWWKLVIQLMGVQREHQPFPCLKPYLMYMPNIRFFNESAFYAFIISLWYADFSSTVVAWCSSRWLQMVTYSSVSSIKLSSHVKSRQRQPHILEYFQEFHFHHNRCWRSNFSYRLPRKIQIKNTNKNNNNTKAYTLTLY